MLDNRSQKSSGTGDLNGGEPRVRATRRSSEEVRGLLIQAARELFGEQGYSGVTTRQIAERAGVSEAILWRQFRTKANLFNIAVADPIALFISDFLQSYRPYLDTLSETDPLPPPERGAHSFFGGLYDVLREQKDLMMTLMAAQAFDPHIFESSGSGAAPLAELYKALAGFSGEVLAAHGLEVNAPMIVRMSIGLVLAVAVFDDLLFPDDPTASREEVVDEMVRLVFYGVTHQKDAPRRRKKSSR